MSKFRQQKPFTSTPVYGCRRLISACVALSALGGAGQVTAAENQYVDEILTLGSRTPGRSAVDMPVPVDTLDAEALKRTGQTEVGRMLQALAPSFNFSSSSISDGTDALRPATLRGLGPDQTLVLINGKRRHQASLIHINTSVGRGTAGVDMNAVPGASIKRIEVLRDGAAAQYGSDAIAGVINIVLNDSADDGGISVSTGEYSEGDGHTDNLDLTKGLALGESGYLNVTLNYRERGNTNRSGLHGSCQFPGCVDTDNDGIREPGDPREVTAPRRTFRIGDADSEQLALVLNSAFDVGDGELYGFITYSSRDNESAAFFRHNANTGGNAPLADGDATIPAGFLPIIASSIDDLSFNVGYRREFDNGATIDLSYTDGENRIDYTTKDSINSSFANDLRFDSGLSSEEIRATIPRSAFAYGLELALQTINLDYTQTYDKLSIAMGAELRTDEYKIIPGEEYSWRDYDTVDGVSLYPVDRDAGIQGFPGIAPESSVDESRDVVSFYLDSEYQISDAALVSAAVRYDDYDGFGDTTNFKLAGNYAITETVRLRGALSTGFRAPSMQQLYFNNLSTQFVSIGGVLVAQQVGTFRNDSTLAQAIGIPALKEEESTNYSLGVILTPLNGLTMTLDYYAIDINDRIVISNRLGTGLSPTLDNALNSAGAAAGQFFLNGADTETRGFDLVASYSGIELADGDLDIVLAANVTKTDVTKLFTPEGSGLATLTTDQVFSSQDISIIEEWQPKDRVSLTGNYTRGSLSVVLAFNRYGEYTVTDGDTQTYGAEILTDLRIGYDATDSLAFHIGANNLFDVYPDENKIGNTRDGAIENGPDGEIIVDSPGVFKYSRRSAPFGFNGAYFYGGVKYSF